MHRFDRAIVQSRPAPITLPDGAAIEQQAAQRPATVHSDVGVPLLQAVITGSVTSALVAVLLWELFGAPMLKVFVILDLAVTSVVWTILLSETRALLYQVERATGLDINLDGFRGDPTKRALQVEVREGSTTQIIGSDWLEIDDAQLLRFARAVVSGATLAEAPWGKDKAMFPRGINQYKSFRAKLANAGLVRPANAAHRAGGYELTHAGRAVFSRLVAEADAQARAHADGARVHDR